MIKYDHKYKEMSINRNIHMTHTMIMAHFHDAVLMHAGKVA